MEQIADGVHLVSGTAVNWVLVQEGSALTVVDTGWPGDVERLDASVRELGLEPQDVSAVLLTHAHVDHVGGLNHWRQQYGTPVFMHSDEVPLARGEQHEQAGIVDIATRIWRPRVAVWTARIVRAGALQHPRIEHAEPWPTDGPLDLPGHPVPVPVPGHTSGHAAYHFPAAGVVVTGDALVTGHPLSSRRGPQLLPRFFSTDPERAATSLAALRDLDADTIAPGHGPAWTGSPADAVDRALT